MKKSISLSGIKQISKQLLFKNTFFFARASPQYTQLLLNNKWVDSKSGKTFGIENPGTEEKICDVSYAGAEDVELAVKYANKAFDNGPWRHMSGYERGRLMNKLADLIERDGDYIANLEAQESGKPYWFAHDVDLALTIKTYRYYAGYADKIHGQTIPIGSNHLVYTRKEPVGVVG